MFDEPLALLQSPCRKCELRHTACWSGCDKYQAYRAALDKINAEKAARRPLDEAFALRGDKIRRDVHKHGLTGRKSEEVQVFYIIYQP